MRVYHIKWLEAHPDRTVEWLSERLNDGFDVHHVDGNALNNDPTNLVLIEHQDHIGLHGDGLVGFRHVKYKYKHPIGPPTHRLQTIDAAQFSMRKQLNASKRKVAR